MKDFAAIDFLCCRQHKKSYVRATVMLDGRYNSLIDFVFYYR